MRKLHHLCMLCVVCLVFQAASMSPVTAQDVLVPVDDYPPWKIVKGKYVTGGIDIALTDYLLGRIGARPVYKLFPWKRCLTMMAEGSADLISGVTRKPARERYLYYLQPPYKTQSVKALFVRRGSGANYRQLSDFENQTVGLLRGAKYFAAFHQNSKIHKFEVNNDLQGLRMVRAGRLDAFILTRENGEYLMSDNPDLKESLDAAHWTYDKKLEVYFAVSRKSAFYAKRHDLEREVANMVDSGMASEIIKNYFK